MRERKEVDLDQLRALLDADPQKKREIQDVLELDRFKISRLLLKKRQIEGGELLTIADVLDIDPRVLSKNRTVA